MGVRMRHPEITSYPADVFADSGGYPEAADEEQAQLWEARGWIRVADDETDFNSLTMAQLRALVDQANAEGRDVSPAGRTKADFVDALEADRTANRAETPEIIQGP